MMLKLDIPFNPNNSETFIDAQYLNVLKLRLSNTFADKTNRFRFYFLALDANFCT